MRYIHPAAWCGLILNFAIIHLFFYGLRTFDFSVLPQAEYELVSVFLELMDSLSRILYGILIGQAAALLMLAARIPYAIVIALVAGFFTVPLGLLYMMGCALSYFRIKQSDYALPQGNPGQTRFLFRAYAARRMRIAMFVSMGLSVFALMSGLIDSAVVLFGITICAIYMAMRTARLPALTLYDNAFAVTTSVFANSLMLPYAAIGMATLLDDESVHFQVDVNGNRRLLVWSLRSIEPGERKNALEELGAALAEHGVPLA